MRKIYGFTLLEILLCVLIIGMIAVIMLKTTKNPNKEMYNDIKKTKVYKVLGMVQNAAQHIKEMEPTKCPLKTFINNRCATF